MAGLTDIFNGYLRHNISSIPCKKVWNEKKQEHTAKVAAISNWSRYCYELPTEEEIESWTKLKEIWGIGVVCGEASNLCCVDVDTTDKELQKRILERLPYTPLVVKGDPLRAGKFIYRLTDSPGSYKPPAELKVKIPEPMNPKKSAVDVFFGNAYMCVPPSLHSVVNGQERYYTWGDDSFTFDTVPEEHIPVLSPLIVEELRMIVDGMTSQMIDINMGGIDLSAIPSSDEEGRWPDMSRLAGGLIKNKTPFEEAVRVLLEHDEERNKGNPYFLSKKHGCNTISNRINAYKFYADTLATAARKKKSIYEVELPRYSRLSGPDRSVIVDQQENAWGPLKTIEDVGAAPTFDVNLIPENIRDTVIAAAEATAVPPQFVFFYLLGTFSSCIGNKMLIQPYHSNTEFIQPANLYVGIVARSGERKSETTRIGRKALLKIHKEKQDEMKEAAIKGAQLNEDIEIRLAKLRKDVEAEIKENGPHSSFVQELREEMETLQGEKVKIREVSLYEQENTAESYYEVCEENPNGIFLEFNEWGSAYDKLLLRESTNLRQFIMNGWDGVYPFSYKTKRNGKNYIEKLCLSVGFSVQESVMSSILWRVENLGKEDDGLVQRFLLIASDGIERPILDRSFQIDDKIYDLFRNAYDIEPSEQPVMLDIEAYEMWFKYQEYIRERVKNERSSAIKSFLSKYVGLVVRIAGNLSCLNNNGGKVRGIQRKDYEAAEKIMRYCEDTMLTLFRKGEFKQYEEIVNKMQMSVIQDGISIRDLCRQHKGLFGKDSKTAMERLKLLHEHNYVRIVQEGKSYKLLINPAVTGGA